MTIPTPGDLSARLPDYETPAMGLHKVIERRSESLSPVDIERLRRAIAALSALPAAGVIEQAARYGWEHASWDWEAVRGGLDRFATTPQPSAVEDADTSCYCMGPDVVCPNCEQSDAAVGAQGDGVLPRDEKACADSWGAVCGLLDELDPYWMVNDLTGREAALAAIRRLAAPAAGKGVDDAMVERFCAAFFTPKWPTSSTHNDNVLRDMVRTALEAALTQQPVAGDGWQPIETAPRTSKAVLIYVSENKCAYTASWREADEDRRGGWIIFGGDWREHLQRATHWQPLPAAPAATPTDGGEGKS